MPLPHGYRTALVTGASRGIGAEIARSLAAEGMQVLALARSADALADLASLPGIRPVVADVTDIGAVAAALAGHEVDVLVNNAGAVGSVAPLHHQTLAETAQVIALNLTAPLQLMQLLLPGMEARGRGHVISLTSAVAQAVFPGTATYAASKAALAMAHQVLRHDLAGRNIRFTEIVPGRVETAFYLSAFGQDAEKLRDTLYARQRALHPQDVAQAILSALTMADRACLSRIELMPTDQAVGGHVFPERGTDGRDAL